MVEEIIGRLPHLTESQLGRLEDELRRERRRRASSEGGREAAARLQDDAALPVTEVLEYHPTRTAICSWSYAATFVVMARPASADRERGPYWYFQFHEGGKRRKLYLGKTSDPESTLTAKRSKPLGE